MTTEQTGPPDENDPKYPDWLLAELAEHLGRHLEHTIPDYMHRPKMTVRDLMFTLAMFDPDAVVIVDDDLGSGNAEPPVVRLTAVQGADDVVEILMPGQAQARDNFKAGR